MKRKSIMFACMTIHDARQELLSRLYTIYDKREAANIADWVMEYLTGWTKIDRLINKQVQIDLKQEKDLERMITELMNHKPVQYVLNESYFCGLKLFVNENVLIPRPETEELVDWIIQDLAEDSSIKTIVDIGTGSGCIPLALRTKLPLFRIFATDISASALEVAKQNASVLKLDINFMQNNILDENTWDLIPEVDILVSNPPYIPEKDMKTMDKNVLLYEPYTALFVKDEDPLLFYKAIVRLAAKKLKQGGVIYVETHENLTQEVASLFRENRLEARVKIDFQGRERMVKGCVEC